MTQIWDRIVEHLEKQFTFIMVYYYVVWDGVNALQMNCNFLSEVQSSWKDVLVKCCMVSCQDCDKEKKKNIHMGATGFDLVCGKARVPKRKGCVLCKRWRHSQSWVCFGVVCFGLSRPQGESVSFSQSLFKPPVVWLNGTKTSLTGSAEQLLQVCRFLSLQVVRLGPDTSLYACFTLVSWLQCTPSWADLFDLSKSIHKFPSLWKYSGFTVFLLGLLSKRKKEKKNLEVLRNHLIHSSKTWCVSTRSQHHLCGCTCWTKNENRTAVLLFTLRNGVKTWKL